MMAHSAESLRRKSSVALLSIVSNLLLVILKVAAGLLIGSVSVLSEAIHSGIDLLAASIAYASVRASGKPADDEHPFGHGKFENLSGAVEAVLIFAAAGWIISEAIHKFFNPAPMAMLGWGMAVMLVSAVSNWIVSRMLMKVGKETDSIALRADAWHLRTDVYTSAGVLVGLLLIWCAKLVNPAWDIAWLDPLVAMGVALLIIKAAWDLTAEAVRDLLDMRLSLEDEAWVRRQARSRQTVRGLHGLRTRKAGPSRFIEFHLIVDKTMTVEDAHRISDELEAEIAGHFPSSHVLIHVEPCGQPCAPECLQGCHVRATGQSLSPAA
ncbi:MAG: cation diffusion facilitator family transporter [bacterium]